MKLRIAVLTIALATLGAVPVTSHAEAPACIGDPDALLSMTNVTGKDGLYAHPASDPTQLVVFNHGYSHNSDDSWRGHLKEAAHHGALAVAMDGTGTHPDPNDPTFIRGWYVSEAATESIEAAKVFLADCPTIESVFILGISMGGNTSGLAVMAGATRDDGSPLFDYWVDVEGVTNVIETYLTATAVGPGNAFAQFAADDITTEMGGSIADVPQAYLDRAVVLHTDQIAANQLKGTIVVHGVDDGLVPHNQSREIVAALRISGVPTDMYTVLTRGDGEAGTTLTGNVLHPAGQESPFAGHGYEGSDTQLVIRTGLDKLFALMDGSLNIQGNGEHIVDGMLGQAP